MPRKSTAAAASSSTKAGSSSTTSKSTSNLASQPSQLNSSVTLFTLDSTQSLVEQGEPSGAADDGALRRSPRKRVKLEPVEDMDMEDLGYGAAVSKASPLLALRNKLVEAKTKGKGKGKAKAEAVETQAEELLRKVKKEEGVETLLRLDDEDFKLAEGELEEGGDPDSAEEYTPDSKRSSPAKRKASTRATKATRKTVVSKTTAAVSTTNSPPKNWEEVYALIKEMRAKIVAPVDTMGCAQAQNKESDPKNRRFATLVSLMLSSQTKDEVTDAAVTKLRAAVGGTLSVENVVNAEESVISDAICKVGFWRRKAGYIKQTASTLQTSFSSDVPKTASELCSLPGVGPKMAYLTLQVAWDLNLGIGVDTHVHRITNRLGWNRPPTKTPEETRVRLEGWLPKELYTEINPLLVGFGQVVCVPVGPKCGECVLSEKGLCPSAVSGKKTKGVKRKLDGGVKVEAKEEEVHSSIGIGLKVELEKEEVIEDR
ncbi:hypothetical protein EST38_g4849 [Candolleomyces aberdarensis]|uniref:Endonuclease III homolog n=1 Tax=Candolleomyces aberdarensis TaxID=2316362 RepID=A0A4Q2DNP3_9AGAR|nr:hypothetical protein EST38_g4849 [Candolleomyces aberdarensis]